MVRQIPRLRATSTVAVRESRYRRLLLPAIILAGTIIRAPELGAKSLWYDELYTLWASALPIDMLLKEVPASGHPPLYYLVMHLWLNQGSGEVWYRGISYMVGVLSIYLMYLLAKELISRRAGLWAAALAAFSPYMVWYSHDATDYSWLIAISTLSVLFLVRSIKRGGMANWSLYVVATIAALFSHYYSIVLVAVEVILFLFLWDRSRRQLRSWLAGQAALALFILPWALAGRDVATTWSVVHMPGWSTLNPLFIAPIVFAKGYAGSIGSGAAALTADRYEVAGFIAFVTVVGAALVFSEPLRRTFDLKLTAGLIICSFILIEVPVLVTGQNSAGRYLALAAPLFILVVAQILAAAPVRVGLPAGVIVLAGLLGLASAQIFWSPNDDWRGIMGTIEAQAGPGEEVLCFPLHNCAMARNLYVSRDIQLTGGVISPFDSGVVRVLGSGDWHGYLDGYGGAENIPAYAGKALTDVLNERLAGADGFWLVAGSGDLGQYPPPDTVVAALAGDWQATGETWDYRPLSLLHYRRRQNV